MQGYFFDRVAQTHGHDISKLILRELGVQVPFGSVSYDWVGFFDKAELRDILGLITVTYQVLLKNNSSKASAWLEFCARALHEEALSYRIDDKGGVHYLVDAEFGRSLSSTIAALDHADFGHARDSLVRLNAALDRGPDTLSAVRECWDANENVFKILFAGKPPRLTENELKLLEPLLVDQYSANGLAAARQMKESFGRWVTAMHQYRHAPHLTDPAPPPLDLAVLMVSQGLGFLRWLAAFKR
ncbi:MAG: hypothetical protein ACT6RD_08245 [Brevundimonas sp.]|uniref:hypothetical protein n=1 Tax=Brevundimonas sp. TaxID=1871086 RepID=UPI004033E9E7